MKLCVGIVAMTRILVVLFDGPVRVTLDMKTSWRINDKTLMQLTAKAHIAVCKRKIIIIDNSQEAKAAAEQRSEASNEPQHYIVTAKN